MGRGPGRWQRELLNAVNEHPKVAPNGNRYIYVLDWVREHLGREPTQSERSAAYRAARQLVKAGKVRAGNHHLANRLEPLGSDSPIPASTPGPTASPAPVEPTPRRKPGPKIKHSDVMERLDASLSGLTMAIDHIAELDQTVTKEQAAESVGNLTQQIKVLNRLKRMLSERAQ